VAAATKAVKIAVLATVLDFILRQASRADELSFVAPGGS